MGDRRCCCGCEVFYDEFNRTGPAVGNNWDEINATGTWGITDNSLWETTGQGEILYGSRIQENEDGYGVSYDIYDEEVGNVYRIIFGSKTSHAGDDCLIAEYEVGETIDDDEDGQPDATSAIRVYSRVSGVETLVAEKYIPPQAVDANGGRRFYAWFHNWYDEGTFCVWIGTSAYPSLLVTTGQTIQDRYFGIANATGSDPINVDNFEIELATYHNVNGNRQPCFWCTCRCQKWQDDDPDSGVLLDDQAYPGVLHVRIAGGCCEPLYPGAPTTGCTDGVDETVDVEFDADYPTVGFNQWVNHTEFFLCGTKFQFRVICSGDGRLSLGFYYNPDGYPEDYWVEIPVSGAIILTRISHYCSPIEEVYTLTLNSLSGFPCCSSMTKGSFTITITG